MDSRAAADRASPPGVPLAYALAPRRRRVRRALVLVVLVAAVAAVWHWWGPIRQRAELLWAQHRCATYAAPPDQVVYDVHPDRTAALRADPAFEQHANHPRTYRTYPQPFVDYMRAAFAAGVRQNVGTVLFLHERRNGRGERRIVALVWAVAWTPLTAEVITPGGVFRPPVRGDAKLRSFLDGGWDPERGLRFFAGQPDPADPARFTIGYELDGQPGVLEGRLGDDDRVSLRSIAGPLQR